MIICMYGTELPNNYNSIHCHDRVVHELYIELVSLTSDLYAYLRLYVRPRWEVNIK